MTRLVLYIVPLLLQCINQSLGVTLSGADGVGRVQLIRKDLRKVDQSISPHAGNDTSADGSEARIKDTIETQSQQEGKSHAGSTDPADSHLTHVAGAMKLTSKNLAQEIITSGSAQEAVRCAVATAVHAACQDVVCDFRLGSKSAFLEESPQTSRTLSQTKEGASRHTLSGFVKEPDSTPSVPDEAELDADPAGEEPEEKREAEEIMSSPSAPETMEDTAPKTVVVGFKITVLQSQVKATQDAIKKLNPVIFLEDVSTGLKIQKLQPQPITMDGLWLVDETNTETEVHVEANHD